MPPVNLTSTSISAQAQQLAHVAADQTIHQRICLVGKGATQTYGLKPKSEGWLSRQLGRRQIKNERVNNKIANLRHQAENANMPGLAKALDTIPHVWGTPIHPQDTAQFRAYMQAHPDA